MSRRTVPARPPITSRAGISEYFGLTEDSKANRELVVRRGELLDVLDALERARKRNSALRRFLRWLAGRQLTDLNPVRLLTLAKARADRG